MSASQQAGPRRVAIAALGPSLDAPTDPRFGRCPCFLLVDAATQEFELVENSSSMHVSGAGIASARRLIEAGATVALVRHMGPNALGVLVAAGIDVYSVGEGATVRGALRSWEQGELRPMELARPFPRGPRWHRSPRPSSRDCRTLEELRLQRRSLQRRLEVVQRQIRSLERGGSRGGR